MAGRGCGPEWGDVHGDVRLPRAAPPAPTTAEPAVQVR